MIVNRVLNIKPSKGKSKNWKVSQCKSFSIKAIPLPEEVDLRASWWGVSDQKQTGSCVGQSSVDGVLRYHLVKIGKISKTQKMSTRFVWTASREMDELNHLPTTMIEGEGTTLKAALRVMQDYGCVPEEVLPFNSSLGYLGSTEEFFEIAKNYKIKNYYELSRNNVLQVKTWLATKGPIFTWLPVNDEFMNCRKVSSILKNTGGADLGGHAVAIVGYKKDGNFIVRNSWGTSWGDNGFAYFDKSYLSRKFQELYGIIL